MNTQQLLLPLTNHPAFYPITLSDLEPPKLVYSEYYETDIPKLCAVYSKEENSYLLKSEAHYVEDIQDWLHESDLGSTYYLVKYEDKYYSEDSTIYSDYDEAHILIDDSIYIESTDSHYHSIHEGNLIVYPYDSDDPELRDNCVYSNYHDYYVLSNDSDYIYLSDGDLVHYEYTDSCAQCGDFYLSDDLSYCDSCGEYSCENCSCDCSRFDGFNCYHGQVLEYSFKPNHWDFIKEKHENTLFLGIELEVEYKDSDHDTLYSICEKYIPGKYFFKTDGSLSDGCEIVFTPHTLQSLKKINFKSFFKDLRKEGFESYTPGTCGLHIHVNREGVKKHVFESLAKFFSNSKAFCRRFSQRTEDNLKSWAEIHDINNVQSYFSKRCSAINFQPSKTVEFRLFRGTLDYRRFKSTLQFVDSIVNAQSIAPKIPLTLRKYKDFLEHNKEYTFLNSYLNDTNRYFNNI